MMQGIEVLSTFKVVSAIVFNLEAFWWTLGGVTCVFFIVGIFCLKSCGWTILPVLFFVGLFMGSFFGYIMGVGAPKPIAYENQYKVTVSEEVSMVEFLDKYEIIEQEGKIFTIREKVSK
jgi:hypothetical protein